MLLGFGALTVMGYAATRFVRAGAIVPPAEPDARTGTPGERQTPSVNGLAVMRA